jgi:hypothetical protein
MAADDAWIERSRRAAFASHRLVGWIFWDPVAIANYAALVPDGLGYYIATRGAPLAAAGNQAVIAAFGSIHPDFVTFALNHCRAHTSFEQAAGARDDAVAEGLRVHVPSIVDELAELADPLWAAADSLSPAGRVLFAAHREWPRPTDPVLSAWLAVNCIREWRGDTHWAVQVNEGLSMQAAGVLDGAWRRYDDHWVARSRGADDVALAAALAELEGRGMATAGIVNAAGLAYRQELEDRLDRLTMAPWRALGAELTDRFCDLVEPVGAALMARVDATAGPNWMPAGRDHLRGATR